MTFTAKMFRRHVIDSIRTGELATSRCPHAMPLGACGGCTFQDRSYTAQIRGKRAALQQLWQDHLPPELLTNLEIIPSPEPYEYRTRMDYIASKERFGLRRGGKYNYIVDLTECHLLPTTDFAIARNVYDRAMALGIPDYSLTRHTGHLRYIVVRRSPQGTLLLAAVTATTDYADELAAIATETLAQPSVIGFHWLLNSTLTDTSFGTSIQHWGSATLPMRVGPHTLDIGPNTFFQNNVHLLLPLLDDVAACVGTTGTVADLYGGVGTIAIHIANQAHHLTCVESVAESAALATGNSAANRTNNITIIAADVLAYLRDQPTGHFDVVIVDPPRIGLGLDVCNELLRLAPQRIIYVSCNAITQREDAHTLAKGYTITQLRGYDMFPQTPHLEALAIFDRIIAT